jgi:hypothetical protein
LLFQFYWRSSFDATQQIFYQGDFYLLSNYYGTWVSWRSGMITTISSVIDEQEQFAVVLKRSRIYQDMNGVMSCVPYHSGFFYLQTMGGARGFLNVGGESLSFLGSYDGYSIIAPINTSPVTDQTQLAIAETQHIMKANKGGYITSINAVSNEGYGQELQAGNGDQGPGFGQNYLLFEDPANSGKYLIQSQSHSSDNYMDENLEETNKENAAHFKFIPVSFDFASNNYTAPLINEFRDIPLSYTTILSQVSSKLAGNKARVQTRREQ